MLNGLGSVCVCKYLRLKYQKMVSIFLKEH